MKNIAVIGAGQLGSRYIQGIVKTSLEIKLEIVEPNIKSIQNTQSRIDEVMQTQPKKNIQISFKKNVLELSENLDIVIIATSSNVRYDLTKELLLTKSVKVLILEKVLFQRENEYYDILDLLRSNQVAAYVNHPLRMSPFIKRLKSKFCSEDNLNFFFFFFQWDFGCNALHYLDIMEFLSGKKISFMNGELLDKIIWKSKRDGFIEITGMLVGKLGNEQGYFQVFSGQQKSPVTMQIVGRNTNIILDKNNQWSCDVSDGILKCSNEKISYFQSDLSQYLIESILNDTCELPLYEDSMLLHIKFIKILIEHLNAFSGVSYDHCPIT